MALSLAHLIVGLAIVALILGLHFIPAIIANRRRHRNALAITALNLFLGWTVIGWVAALIWALTNDPPPPTWA